MHVSVFSNFFFFFVECFGNRIWSGYYFWDVLATASFLNPNLFLTSVKNVTILTEGRRQGATIIDNVHGRPVTIVEFVSAESFHSYILNQFTKI